MYLKDDTKKSGASAAKQRVIFIASGAYNPALLRSVGANSQNTRVLTGLQMGVARLTVEQIAQLQEQQCISCVIPDRPVHALLDRATHTIGSRIVNLSGLTGRGITVAVLDTGIAQHPDFRRRIIGFKDLVRGKKNSYDDNGHGTHVAGIVAGNGLVSQQRYCGVAPQARLVGVKVLDRRGSGLLSNVLMGLEWCIQNKRVYNIKIVNLSLGGPSFAASETDPLCHATERLLEAGIIVIAAAGNSGPSAESIESPGCCPSAITVGAVNDRDTISPDLCTVADFSSRGPTIDGLNKPDICAPGVSIVAPRARRSYPRRIRSWKSYSYHSLSGTSMAAPMVSGVAALLLQGNPDRKPADIKSLLLDSTVKLYTTVPAQGAGLVRVKP